MQTVCTNQPPSIEIGARWPAQLAAAPGSGHDHSGGIRGVLLGVPGRRAEPERAAGGRRKRLGRGRHLGRAAASPDVAVSANSLSVVSSEAPPQAANAIRAVRPSTRTEHRCVIVHFWSGWAFELSMRGTNSNTCSRRLPPTNEGRQAELAQNLRRMDAGQPSLRNLGESPSTSVLRPEGAGRGQTRVGPIASLPLGEQGRRYDTCALAKGRRSWRTW